MTERTDLLTRWGLSPRIIELSSATPEPRSITLQDLHDTLKSNTEQASEADDSLENMDDDPLIDSAGKEDLGDGVLVGITSTFDLAKLAFIPDTVPEQTGTVTTPDATGTVLIDSAALFISNLVEPGAWIINWTDRSITSVISVLSETQLTTFALSEGTDDQWDSADAYTIWNVEQCDITGGNLVAIDGLGDAAPPVLPTALTQIVRTASSSATQLQEADIEQMSYEGAIWIDAVNGNDANNGKPATPVLTATAAKIRADAVDIMTYKFRGSITLAAPHDRWRFIGMSAGSNDVLNLNNQSVDESYFESCQIAGDATESSMEAYLCELDNPGNLYGLFRECGLLNTFKVEATTPQTYVFHLCYSQVAGSGRPSVDFTSSAATHNVQFRNYTGGLDVINCTNGNLSVDAVGTIDLKSTVTGEDLVIRGVGNFIDSSVGATVSALGFVKGADIDIMRKVIAGGRVEIVGTSPATVNVYEDDLVTIAHSWTVTADLRTRLKV